MRADGGERVAVPLTVARATVELRDEHLADAAAEIVVAPIPNAARKARLDGGQIVVALRRAAEAHGKAQAATTPRESSSRESSSASR